MAPSSFAIPVVAIMGCAFGAVAIPLALAHGEHADFRGEDGVIYNFLSVVNVSMNVKIEKVDLHWKQAIPWKKTVEQVVHQTRITAVYWTIMASDGKLVTVSYELRPSHMGLKDNETVNAYYTGPRVRVHIDGKEITGSNYMKLRGWALWRHANVQVLNEHGPLSLRTDGVRGSAFERLHGGNLSDYNSKWLFGSSPTGAGANDRGHSFLDVGATPQYDAESDPVAPHGILGQSLDGDSLAVDGARDGLVAAQGPPELFSTAQAEGAIEGNVSDYVVAHPFAVDFKFSRFNSSVPVPSRNVSQLTGEKHEASMDPSSWEVKMPVPYGAGAKYPGGLRFQLGTLGPLKPETKRPNPTVGNSAHHNDP